MGMSIEIKINEIPLHRITIQNVGEVADKSKYVYKLFSREAKETDNPVMSGTVYHRREKGAIILADHVIGEIAAMI